jgi:hypothetical protein
VARTMNDDLPILNLSSAFHKRLVKNDIDRRKGLHVVHIYKLRDQRTLSQNAYLHGVVFATIAGQLGRLWGRDVNMLEAKDFLKDKFLRVPLADARGEVVGQRTLGTHELDTEQCGRFIDDCVAFALDELEFEVPPPRDYCVSDEDAASDDDADGIRGEQ